MGGRTPTGMFANGAWKPIRRRCAGARPQADYLIERARQMFPGAGAEQKVKAMNFLLPHIRRMPEKLARDQFAADAAQKLGIDSAVLREELAALTEVEKVLLRALAIVDPDYQRARKLAVDAIVQQPTWFEELRSFEAMKALAQREANDPMAVVDDPAQQALLAEALLGETRPPEETEVASSLQQVQERTIESRLRQLRASIADAERRGDFTEIAILMKQKMELDSALRRLHWDNHQ